MKAIVTGGARGIGSQIAITLASKGFDVAIIATRDSLEAQATLKEIQKFNRKGILLTGDISQYQEACELTEKAIEYLSGLQALVNCAGIIRDGIYMSMKEEDINQVLDVNLKGSMYMTRACLRTFVKQRQGDILNISSVSGLRGNAGQANYAAAKAGLIGFTKTIALEYGGKGIRCNVIAPGFIETQMTQGMKEEARKRMSANIPLKRLGSPEEVGALAGFLLSNEASYITGQTFCIDGGLSCQMGGRE